MRLAVCFLVSASVAVGHASEFERYRSESAVVGRPVAPLLTTAASRRFRTVLRTAAAQGPNFNGRYRVVHWGCGTNCIQWAVINLQSGYVWLSAEEVYSWWSPDIPLDLKGPSDWLEHRVDSSL